MAMLWGSTFVVTKDAMTTIPAADLLAVRYTIALGVLVVFMWRHVAMSRRTAWQGAIMGILFSIGQLTLTFGLASTDASVSGFLTGTYVIFTPLLASLLWKRRMSRNIWRAVALAIFGLGILSAVPSEGSSGFGIGAILTLISAAAFAGHILATGRFATPANARSLTLAQTSVLVVLSWTLALPGGVVLPVGTSQWLVVLYLAVIAGAATLFLQNWAQAYVEPTKAAVVMVSEPVWAAVFAVALGAESLTWQMVVGGAAIIGAMYLVSGRAPVLRLPGIVPPRGVHRGLDRLAAARSRRGIDLGYRVSIQAAVRQRT